jgi:hypothetical protein
MAAVRLPELLLVPPPASPSTSPRSSSTSPTLATSTSACLLSLGLLVGRFPVAKSGEVFLLAGRFPVTSLVHKLLVMVTCCVVAEIHRLPLCPTTAISAARLRLLLLHGCRRVGSGHVHHRPPSSSSSRNESAAFLGVPGDDGAPIWVTSPKTCFSPPRPPPPQPRARCCSSSSASARSTLTRHPPHYRARREPPHLPRGWLLPPAMVAYLPRLPA